MGWRKQRVHLRPWCYWWLCLIVRSVTVDRHKPSPSLTRAQRLAGHLPTSKPPQSSDKTDVRQKSAASNEAMTVTKTVSSVEKLTPAEPEELSTLPQPIAAELVQVDEQELQQKKVALRLVFLFVASISRILSLACWHFTLMRKVHIENHCPNEVQGLVNSSLRSGQISYHIVYLKWQNRVKVGAHKPKLKVKVQSVSDDDAR